MTNLDYENIETPTGDWSGSASLPPTHYGEYKVIYSSVTGVEKPNGIITFDNLPANLKIVSGSGLNLPFDRVYVDIDGYSDYVMLDSDGDGNYREDGITGFVASYTSGGFWLLGDDDTDPPGVILMAQGSAPTGTADILNLYFTSIASTEFSAVDAGGYYIDMNSNDAIVFPQDYSNGGTPLNGFILNKNEYSWQKKIFSPILNEGYNFSYITNSGFGGLLVSGLDSNNVPKSFLFSYDDLVPEALAVAFWWQDDTLTGQIFTNINDSIQTPAPFNGSIIASTYAEYIGATVYADEPMISYSVIDDHTIQITSDIDSVISPLKKLYINFSGIS
jgi:hypothetical protein